MERLISFCRHGQTYENLIEIRADRAKGTKYEKTYQIDFRKKFGKDDSGKLYSLNKNAENQAQQLGIYLKNKYKNVGNQNIIFISSTLRRAQDTTKIIAQEMEIPLSNRNNFFLFSNLSEQEIFEFRVQNNYLPSDVEERLMDPKLGKLSQEQILNLKSLIKASKYSKVSKFFKELSKENTYIRERCLPFVSENLVNIVKKIIEQNREKSIIFVGHAHSTGSIIQGLGIKLLKEHFDVNCWSYDILVKNSNKYVFNTSFIPSKSNEN